MSQGITTCFDLPSAETAREGGSFNPYNEEAANDSAQGVPAYRGSKFEQSDIVSYKIAHEFLCLLSCLFPAAGRVNTLSADSESQLVSPPADTDPQDDVLFSSCEEELIALNGLLNLSPEEWKERTPCCPGRKLKRFNAKTILWFFTYSRSGTATSQLLDKMWSSAKK